MTAPLRGSDPIVVNVALGERSYDIVIGRGQLASLGARIAALRPGAKAAIVTDETVARHHLAAADAALAAAGVGFTSVTVPPGESSKSFAMLERVCDALIAARIERGDLGVAVGGGETGERALLNLGHTFGHALEAAAGFSGALLHGEAISLGMVLAFELSARRGLVAPAESARVARHLAAVGLPTRVASAPGGVPDVD